MHGTWKTTGGGSSGGAAAVAVLLVFIVLGSGAAAHAVRLAGDLLVIGLVTIVAVAVGVGVTIAVVRLQGHRRAGVMVYDAKTVRPGIRWQANPNALPLPEPRAIPAPVQPVVNVHIDAGLLAGLMEAARRQQHAPVIIPSETEEIPR